MSCQQGMLCHATIEVWCYLLRAVAPVMILSSITLQNTKDLWIQSVVNTISGALALCIEFVWEKIPIKNISNPFPAEKNVDILLMLTFNFSKHKVVSYQLQVGKKEIRR